MATDFKITRRCCIASGAAAVLATQLDCPKLFGAIRSPQAPNYRRIPEPRKGIGRGKRAYLWTALERVMQKPLEPHVQHTGTHSEGDCVAQSTALAIDILAAQQHVRRKSQFVDKASVEAIYWGARNEIGENVLTSDGCIGHWAADFVQKYGVLNRRIYESGENAIDLRGYDAKRSRSRRRSGVPDWLEPIAREHPVKTIWSVDNSRDMRDFLSVGAPVMLCSTYAVSTTRDKDGFSHLLTGAVRPRWHHAWAVIGMDDMYKRPGALVISSWGPHWITGPRRHNQPEGSFWLSWDEIDTMIGDWKDCHAFLDLKGFPRKRNLRLY